MSTKIEHIKEIKLDGVLPRVMDDPESRSRLADSQLMLARTTLVRGKHYCINASSGRGKTSLLSFIYGSRRDYLGSIHFDSTDAASLSIGEWCDVRRRCLAYLPQELDIFDRLTALENIQLKNRLTDYKSEAEIRQMMKRLEVDNLLDRPAGRMSVGQRQRVALVRALCQPFDFVLLDEPVSHLDARSNSLCGALIAEETTAQGASAVFTSVGNRLDLNLPVTDLNL